MEQQHEQQYQQQLQQIQQQVVQQVQQVQQQEAQQLASGVANAFISIPQPLPGQPRLIVLRINNQLRVLPNPTTETFDQVQEAFAFGQHVVGIWHTQAPSVLRSIRIQRI
ncbi:hypothetical protein [Streptomyces niger]|uniref:hypothetical protein n=1 Tax=Streptomyces niger TaxID=66373 RepID=UPI000B12DF72|nr:hypothetical protein [Streptomyces niger]